MTDERLKDYVAQVLHPETVRRDAPSEYEALGHGPLGGDLTRAPVRYREVAEEPAGADAIETVSTTVDTPDEAPADNDPVVEGWYDSLEPSEQAAVMADGDQAASSYWSYLEREMGDGEPARQAFGRWLATAEDEPEAEPEPDRSVRAEARQAVDAWYGTLTATEREAIRLDPDASDAPFAAWLARRVPPDEAAALVAAAQWEAEQPSYLETVGTEPPVPALVRGILADPQAAGYANRETAESWLIFSATADEATWTEYCRQVGWDPSLRPSRGDLPWDLESGILEANLERRGAARAADGRRRYLGE
jgi:hypothetical protein